MLYKMALRRKWKAEGMAAILRDHGGEVAEHLEQRMSAVLEEGETMPDVAHLLDLFGRMLIHESESLDEVETKRVREGTDLNLTRKELRERVEPELRERVIWVRDQMRNAYGAEEANRLLSHQGRTPRALEGLKKLATVMVTRLPILEPPRMRTGPPPNLVGWATYVQPALEDFSWHMAQIGGRSGDEKEVVVARKKALAEFDWTYRRVVRLKELIYELAGLEIKSPRHRKGRPPEQTKTRPSQVA